MDNFNKQETMKNLQLVTVLSTIFWASTTMAAGCPQTYQYARIHYDHFLRNYSASGNSIFDQVVQIQDSDCNGGVDIKISKNGVINAGNNIVKKEIAQFNSSTQCDCLSQPDAKSQVTVTVTGSCSNGTLYLHLHEEHPASSATMVCTGSDSCPVYYEQPYPAATSDFDLSMPYADGYTVTRPYTCPNCSGNYSWTLLKLTGKPSPLKSGCMSLVPLIVSPLLLGH